MQFVRNLKHIFAIWCITLIALFGVVGLFGKDFLIPITHFFIYRETGIQSSLYPYHFTPSKNIAIVKIDDASLNSLQAESDLKMLTIPKSVYIDLIEKLESVWVKGIGIDIVFQNKDPDEEKFAETMKKYSNIVIATQLGNWTERWASVVNTWCQKDKNTEYITCEGMPRSVYKDIPWGFTELYPLADRMDTLFDTTKIDYASWKDQKNIHSLASEIFLRENDNNKNILKDFNSKNYNLLIPFFGQSKNTYTTFSLGELLKIQPLIRELAWKYVFIWESGTNVHDAHNSPVTGAMMDGVEFHAHMLDGFLQKRFLIEMSMNEWMFYIIGILLLSLISIIAYLFLPKFISPIVALITLVFLIFLSRYLYFNSGIVIEIFPVLLAWGVFSFPITFIYRFFIIDREKRALTSAFSHYVDPTLVREIADKSAEINLWGESRELSILFSDIAGFTTLSEKLSPSDLFYLMSSYLSQMTDILIAQWGTLDKYIGDAVMGFFWAPLPEADHARRACDTALLMREALPEFNAELISRGLDPIEFRIGIASGEVLVGNIGSHDRFNYTVLGDTVNLASRLEATSKEYGTHTIIAEPTYLLLEGAYFCRALDRVAVKGKTEWVLIYELIAKNDDTKISREKYMRYEEALKLYFEEKYLEAGKLFEANMVDDAPSKVMALRCVEILKWSITVEGWVYRMTHK